MSGQVALAPATDIGRTQAAEARLAVAAARALCLLPPTRIERVLTVLRRGARPATAVEVAAARNAAMSVSVLCAGQGCLPRSLAAAILCRRRGAWPTWCVGVRTAPFAAHAWLEVDGAPIGESPGIAALSRLIVVPALR